MKRHGPKSHFTPEQPFTPEILTGKPFPKKHAAREILIEPARGFTENTRTREVAERQLLYAVAELTAAVRSQGLRAAITGGLATRAYAGPTRFTHDADMVVAKQDFGKLKRILKDMGYRGDLKEFGKGEIMFAVRNVEDRAKGLAFKLKIDVAVGGIYDHSSGIVYNASERLFLSSRNLPVRGYFPTSSSVIVTAQVVSLEDLFLLKTMTVATPDNGREKDIIDALLLALKNPPDLVRVWSIACEQGISSHVRGNIERKLLPYLERDEYPLMGQYGFSFSRDEKSLIGSYLVSLLAHYGVVSDPRSNL